MLTYSQQNIFGDVCEIGVAKGKSAICLSNFKRVEDALYLYDNFSEKDRIIADRNIEKFGDHNNIVWKNCDTTTLSSDDIVTEKGFRLLHIDGCHEHWAVLSDLMVFSNKVNDDGVIVVDDFNDYEFPGVNSAVHQYCLSDHNYKKWRVFAIGDNKAFLCLQKNSVSYRNSLLTFMERFNQNSERPFEIKMCLRQVYDTNVLLCNAREVWSSDKIRENFDKKLTGLL